MSDAIHILIVDDHPVVRRGLRTLIETEPGMEVVGEAADGLAAVNESRTTNPDVILLDLVMPGYGGLDVLPQLIEVNPAVRILVLTSYSDSREIYAVIKAGASGYLLKDSLPEQLLQAIRDVHRGEVSMHPTIASKLVQELKQPQALPHTKQPLTSRELEVLELLAQGMSNREIAASLDISERTVANHISKILEKLHLANRTQAALFALREGLAELKDV